MAKMSMKVNCPTCSKSVIWNECSKFRPFCSDRCRLIDLGLWADEQHKITEKLDRSMPDEIDVEAIEEMLAASKDDFFKS